MRRFSPESLTRIGCALFEAAGCSEVDARTVAEHLVESSLFGHDSHGTLRLYEYIDQIEAGTFDAKGRPRVVRERGPTAIPDGGGAPPPGRPAPQRGCGGVGMGWLLGVLMLMIGGSSAGNGPSNRRETRVHPATVDPGYRRDGYR